MSEGRSDTLELRLDQDVWAEVDSIAEATAQDRHAVVGKAVDAYLEMQRWQIARIKEGLKQAEAGEFASDEEVARAFRRSR